MIAGLASVRSQAPVFNPRYPRMSSDTAKNLHTGEPGHFLSRRSGYLAIAAKSVNYVTCILVTTF